MAEEIAPLEGDDLIRTVQDALTHYIATHGPIIKSAVGSAARRIVGLVGADKIAVVSPKTALYIIQMTAAANQKRIKEVRKLAMDELAARKAVKDEEIRVRLHAVQQLLGESSKAERSLKARVNELEAEVRFLRNDLAQRTELPKLKSMKKAMESQDHAIRTLKFELAARDRWSDDGGR